MGPVPLRKSNRLSARGVAGAGNKIGQSRRGPPWRDPWWLRFGYYRRRLNSICKSLHLFALGVVKLVTLTPSARAGACLLLEWLGTGWAGPAPRPG